MYTPLIPTHDATSGEHMPRVGGFMSEILRDRRAVLMRALETKRAGVAFEQDSTEAERRMRLPEIWTRSTNFLGRAGGVVSTHSEADADAVRHLVDGNVMGLREIVPDTDHAAYVDSLGNAAATEPETEQPTMNQLVQSLAHSTDSVRETFLERLPE